ncbi:MAG: hypothetical protein JNM39_09025 [Bdellovibrionaceae bacterium]|nr:hypothetical protein [Pseudobdellovibrionaceae bacterium]
MNSKLILAVLAIVVGGHFASAQEKESECTQREKVKVLDTNDNVLAELNATGPNLELLDSNATLSSYNLVSEKGKDDGDFETVEPSREDRLFNLYMILKAEKATYGDPRSKMPFIVEKGIRFSIRNRSMTYDYMILPGNLNAGTVCDSIRPFDSHR